ncbi:MAG: hypothetical protein ACFCA4_02200 [Cyanophyceae cyanobacterium]
MRQCHVETGQISTRLVILRLATYRRKMGTNRPKTQSGKLTQPPTLSAFSSLVMLNDLLL